MLRDVITGLIWAGLGFTYFVLVILLSPLEGRSTGEAWDLLVILGGGLAAIMLLHFFTDGRDHRRQRAFQAKMDEQDRLARETAREKALRLNAYPAAPAGCSTATGSGVAFRPMAQIIPFPARHSRSLAIGHLQGSA